MFKLINFANYFHAFKTDFFFSFVIKFKTIFTYSLKYYIYIFLNSLKKIINAFTFVPTFKTFYNDAKMGWCITSHYTWDCATYLILVRFIYQIINRLVFNFLILDNIMRCDLKTLTRQMNSFPYSTKAPEVLLRSSASFQIPPHSKMTGSEVPEQDILNTSSG